MYCARLAGNAGPKKSPSGHHRTTLSGCIFATKARIHNQKKILLSSNISSTCPHNMVNFGPLAAEIGPVVWGIPANFNGFCVLAALLHSTVVVGFSHTLRRWTEGATYIRQGGHHIGHWLTFLIRLICHCFMQEYVHLNVFSNISLKDIFCSRSVRFLLDNRFLSDVNTSAVILYSSTKTV